MSDDQTAGLPSGVGLTAVGVAHIRASESQRENPLFSDELAWRFVAASGWTIAQDVFDPDERRHAYWAALVHWVVVRTRFLDDLLLRAAEAGCRQVVILGAGLDTRAFRLDWPDGVRFFELDLPDVLDFKEDVLRRCGAAAHGVRTVIRADLLGDWPAALRAAGFHREEPTTWIAEGLLIYLTAEQNDRLLTEVSALSARGSVLGLTWRMHSDIEPVAEQSMSGTAGATIEPTFRSMWKSRAPDDPAAWLEDHGWRAELFHARERAEFYGRPIPEMKDAPTSLLVRAERLD